MILGADIEENVESCRRYKVPRQSGLNRSGVRAFDVTLIELGSFHFPLQPCIFGKLSETIGAHQVVTLHHLKIT